MSIAFRRDELEKTGGQEPGQDNRPRTPRGPLARGVVVVLGAASLSMATVGEPAAAVEQGMGWYLSSSFGGTGDVVCNYGSAGDKVVVGDWNGDGVDSPGVFRNGTWYLSNSCGGTGDYIVPYGNADDIPVVGDWDGNGTDTPGVFRNGNWYLSNGFNGQVDYAFGYGNWNDKPVVGDWDGNGTDTPGVFQNATWALSNGFNGQVNYSFVYGVSSDIPVVGDWDGNGTDTPGIIRGATWTVSNAFGGTGDHSFNYGSTGDNFVAGDWNGGSGPDGPGIARPGDLPQWQQRWIDNFDGTGTPEKWEPVSGTNADKSGGAARVDVGDSIWTTDMFAIPQAPTYE